MGCKICMESTKKGDSESVIIIFEKEVSYFAKIETF